MIIDNLNQETAEEVFRDLQELEKIGFWKDKILPTWAQEICDKLGVLGGSMHIREMGYRALAVFYHSELNKLLKD